VINDDAGLDHDDVVHKAKAYHRHRGQPCVQEQLMSCGGQGGRWCRGGESATQ
jgi:hypothetical protein